MYVLFHPLLVKRANILLFVYRDPCRVPYVLVCF